MSFTQNAKGKKGAYIESAADDMPKLFAHRTETESGNFTPTGLSKVDDLLSGGLRPLLYCVGAMSSLGKTTFCNQLGDNIAKRKRHVLFFSLEMSKIEMIAKSISRLTYTTASEKGQPQNALTELQVSEGYLIKKLTDSQHDTLNTAEFEYNEFNKYIHIIEGDNHTTTADIKEIITDFIDSTDKKPVVFVDYLQMVRASDELRGSDRRLGIIENIGDFKTMSRDFNIPIVLICSTNRESYGKSISFEAFKEAGEIEFTADYVLGLEFKGADSSNFDYKKAKREDVRQLNFVVLKGRKSQDGKLPLEYVPKFNHFTDAVHHSKELSTYRQQRNDLLAKMKEALIFYKMDTPVLTIHNLSNFMELKQTPLKTILKNYGFKVDKNGYISDKNNNNITSEEMIF